MRLAYRLGFVIFAIFLVGLTFSQHTAAFRSNRLSLIWADSLTVTADNISGQPGLAFSNVQVASFTDSNTSDAAAAFTATIDWGDGTTTTGTVSGSNGSFTVTGSHTYSNGGNFTLTITIVRTADNLTGSAQGAATVNLALTPQTLNLTEGVSFNNGAVATFTDSNGGDTAASFTATISWGDGTTTAGTVSGGAGSFTVSGSHTYADEGFYSVPITITHTADNATAVANGSAAVAEGDSLTGTPKTFSAFKNVSFSGNVASFTTPFAGNVANDFTATIDWGDGTTTAGTISGSAGSFSVSGTHTYASPGTFTVKVTMTDDAPGTATATVNSTAKVCAALTISCPASITKFADSGQSGAMINPGTPVATGCGALTVKGVRSDGKPLNALYPVGTTLITWSAKDSTNQTVSCTQTIMVMVPSGQRRIPIPH